MTQLAVLKREAKTRRRTGMILAVAIIAAMVAGGWFYGGRLLDSGNRTLPAGPTAPEGWQNVARAFLHAYGNQDADRAISYLTDEAIARNWESPEAIRRQLAWDEASGYREVINHCDQQGDSVFGHRLRCDFSFHALRSEEIGLGPYHENHWVVTVNHGRIVSADNELSFASNGFSKQMWEPFAAWVAAKYPADAEVMYTDSSLTLEQQTQQSIALWDQRTRQYAASADAYISRANAICTAAHQRASEVGGTTVYPESWGRILDQALVELRSVAPPSSVRTRFEKAYGLVEQLADGLSTGQPGVQVIHRLESSGLGLAECTFDGPR